MSDAAATPKKAGGVRKKSAKPKSPRQHPPYGVMIRKAIAALKDRKGSSRQALIKFIRGNFKIGAKENVDLYVRMALRSGIKHGKLVQSKGVGASGSFRLPEKAKKASKVKKAKKPKKAKKSPKKKAAGAKKHKKAAKPTAAAADGSTDAVAATPARKAPKAKKPKRTPAKKSPKAKKSPAKKRAGSAKKAGAKKRAKK